MKMKKEHVEILNDQFTDENGELRYFTIAAVSTPLEESKYPVNHLMNCFGGPCEMQIDEVVKKVTLGYSVCKPGDTYSKELGETIALGRARKNGKAALYSTMRGYINTRVVQALLRQEADYFKANPEVWIKGYRRNK
jgi:hypothetical protein